MDDLRDRAMGALVADDPRRAAEVALSLLLTNLRLGNGSIHRCRGTAITLWVSRGIEQDDLDRVDATWSDAQESILAGHAYTEDEFAIVPARGDGGRTLGLIYVGARRPVSIDATVIGALLPLFCNALSCPEPGSERFDDYVQSVTLEQIERQQLLLQLERHEWNLSRVARALDVERWTVYNRMRRLGIPRKRIWKTPRS